MVTGRKLSVIRLCLWSYQIFKNNHLAATAILSWVNVYINPMVRPLKADRDAIAETTIRVSVKTKQLLHDLRLKHGFATTDQVLRYYLLRLAIEENNKVDRLVKGASNQIMQKINKSELNQSKSKPVHKQTSSSWQRRQRKF